MTENLILDSGVIVKWVIREHDTELAVAIYQRFQAGEFRILIPDLVFAEFGNILWKKRMLEGLPDVDAEAAIKIFKEIPFIITPSQSLFRFGNVAGGQTQAHLLRFPVFSIILKGKQPICDS